MNLIFVLSQWGQGATALPGAFALPPSYATGMCAAQNIQRE